MSLKVWLPLNGNLHNQGISNYIIDMFRGNEVYNTTGKIGQCFYANGVNTIKINNIIPDMCNYSAYSLCAWAYIEAQNTSHSGSAIISGGNWNNPLFNLALSNWSTDHYTKLRITGSNWNRTYDYNFMKNTWYHIVVCDDGIKTYAYVNGTLINDTATSYLPKTVEGTNLCIGGATYYSGMQFFGKINDVRIYDHCLSAAEVKEIAQGLILHYKLDSIGPGLGNPNLLKNTDKYSLSGSGAAGITRSIEDGVYKVVAATTNSNYCTFTSHNTTLDLTQGDTFTFSMMIKSPDSVKKPTVYFQSGLGYYNTSGTMSPEWSIIYYTGTWSISNLTTNIHLGFKAAPGTYYIKYLKIEKGSTYTPWAPKTGERYSDINIVDDSSGYNHNGQIISNTVITRNTTRYSTSMLFDGVDDCIIVPYNAICPENIFTINLWFKKDALGSKNYETLFGGPSGFEMDTRAGSSTALSLYMASTRGGNAATGLQLNTWYMVTMVRDGTNERYYINGELEKEIAAKAMPTGVYRIGAWDSNTKQNYYGNISDFRIYCTPLLDTDIKQLYNTSMKIDKNNSIHSFEVIENNKNKINKEGQLECKEINEINFTTNVKNCITNEWITNQIIER